MFKTSVLACNQRTELMVQPFADRILVLVTQMGKVGNLIQASIPSTADLRAYTSFDVSDLQAPIPAPSPAIQLVTIFGSAPSARMQTLYSLYASQIATLIWLSIGGEPRSVIVGLALQGLERHEEGDFDKEEQETFHRVMEALRALMLNQLR